MILGTVRNVMLAKAQDSLARRDPKNTNLSLPVVMDFFIAPSDL